MLNYEQELVANDAVNWFKNSSEQVFELEGGAGTGKTFTIYEILRRLNLNANQYMPMAYTGQASIVMRTRGFHTARSIHSSLYESVDVYDTNLINNKFGLPTKRKQFKLREFIDPNIDLFFIDEGYMVPDYMVNDILSFGKKVIVCGDSNQLPPVGGKPGFFTGKFKTRRIHQLMRQAENDPIVYLAQRALKGEPIHSGMYGNSVLVVDDSELCPAMIGFADCIACGTNRTRDILNSYVRQLARFDDSPIPKYGERVICRNNNWQMVQDGLALANGLCGTVLSQPGVGNYNGKVFNINFKPDLANTVFYDVPVNYEYFVANYDNKQIIKDKTKLFGMQGEMFEFAYALSTWLCQGSEYNNLIYIEEFMRPQIQNQLNYTGITRAKRGLIYLKKKNKYIYIPDSNKIFQ